MPACDSIFVKVVFIPAKEYIASPRYLWVLSPPPSHKLHPEDSLEVDAVPLGHLIVELPRMVFSLLRNMKSKLMVGVVFVLFVITTISHYGVSYTFALSRKSYSENILMISSLRIIFLFIEVMVKFPYSLLLTRQS